jgi:hypothetical protein
VKGQSIELRIRIQVPALFAVSFVGAAFSVFALATAAGTALHMLEVSLAWRHGIASTILLALAAVDLHAVRRKTYCPISWRRQTPRVLMRWYSPRVVAVLWGLDTGLAVTTFRVSAATWGALLLAFLGFGTWWIGLCYGVGFVVPLMVLLCVGPIGTASAAGPDPLDPGLHGLLASRPFAQVASALLLGAGAIAALAFALGVPGIDLAMAR